MVTFRHYAGFAIYHVFNASETASGTKQTEVIILGLARLDAWNASFIELLRGKECRGGRHQKHYSDSFGKLLHSATTQFVEAVRHFAEYWHPKGSEKDTQTSSVDLRKDLLDMFREATRIFLLSSLSKIFLAIDTHWYNTFISKNLGDTQDCYVQELANDFESIHRLGSDGP